jgi:hypothetical protein
MRKQRLIVGALLLAVLACGVWLLLSTRRSEVVPKVAEPTAPPDESPNTPIRAIARPLPVTVSAAAARPPKVGYDAQGRPQLRDTRPGPAAPSNVRNQKLDTNGLPMKPPVFEDPRERAQFKKWWVDGFVHRMDIYEKLHPRDGYPSDGDAQRMMDRFYELAEEQRPGEDPYAYASRSHELMNELYPRFVALFGVPPYSVQSEASDPMYGPFPPPPVQPRGTAVEAAPDEPPPPDKPPPPLPPQPSVSPRAPVPDYESGVK